jgi:hypothetical protein
LQALTEGFTEGHIVAPITDQHLAGAAKNPRGLRGVRTLPCVRATRASYGVLLLTTLRHARFDFNQKKLKPIILI